MADRPSRKDPKAGLAHQRRTEPALPDPHRPENDSPALNCPQQHLRHQGANFETAQAYCRRVVHLGRNGPGSSLPRRRGVRIGAHARASAHRTKCFFEKHIYRLRAPLTANESETTQISPWTPSRPGPIGRNAQPEHQERRLHCRFKRSLLVTARLSSS